MGGISMLMPPFVNSYIRKLTLAHLMSIFLFISGVSCVVNTVDEGDVIDDVVADDEENYSYPPIGVGSEESNDQISDQWMCGYEIIVVEGPDNKLIYSEVPIPCDPIADVYLGCPAPM